METDNVVKMPVRKNVLGGTIHVFKTKEQMEAIKAAKQAKEETNATEENSN